MVGFIPAFMNESNRDFEFKAVKPLRESKGSDDVPASAFPKSSKSAFPQIDPMIVPSTPFASDRTIAVPRRRFVAFAKNEVPLGPLRSRVLTGNQTKIHKINEIRMSSKRGV